MTVRRALRSRAAVAALLAAAAALVYARAAGLPFIYFDDPRYVTGNPAVQGGLSWGAVRWAFTTLAVSNWHPLTWLSHLVDVQLFGESAPAHHLVNVALHAANAALLFLALARLTGATGRSACVAALFAVHPLHVESVAWVAERKDVLSTLLGLLALLAWARYVERRTAARYALTALAFAASLLAKPMWVTFPFLLLLLDWWPLGRLPGSPPAEAAGSARPGLSLGAAALEKLPLLALSAASSAMTVVAQSRGRAVVGLRFGVAARAGNAAVAYVRYLEKTLWPADLSIFYPLRAAGLDAVALACVALLAAVSAAAVLVRRRAPWLAVGWLWYLGTLVPVIGLVQVGAQGMADRYTYLPLVGVFAAAVWGAARLAGAWHGGAPLRVATAALLVALGAATWRQEGFWSSHETLFRHALEAGGESAMAHGILSAGLRVEGRYDEALVEARRAVWLDPGTDAHWNNLGKLHLVRGEPELARDALAEATRIEPLNLSAWSNLAQATVELGRTDEAAAAISRAMALDPEDGAVWNTAGELRVRLGDPPGALAAFREAVRLQPRSAEAWTNLGVLAQGLGVIDEAGRAFAAVADLQPQNPIAWRNLGVYQAKNGRPALAAEAFRRALALAPGDADLQRRLAAAEGAATR